MHAGALARHGGAALSIALRQILSRVQTGRHKDTSIECPIDEQSYPFIPFPALPQLGVGVGVGVGRRGRWWLLRLALQMFSCTRARIDFQMLGTSVLTCRTAIPSLSFFCCLISSLGPLHKAPPSWFLDGARDLGDIALAFTLSSPSPSDFLFQGLLSSLAETLPSLCCSVCLQCTAHTSRVVFPVQIRSSLFPA